MAPSVLDGFTVGVTADRRAEEQCEMLARRGAKVLHAPAVRTLPLAGEAGLRAATERLIADPPDALVANTGIGIRSWFAAAESWGLGGALLDALRDADILARGPKAAGAVLTAGLQVSYRAPSETLAEAIDHVLGTSAAHGRIALQLDGAAEQSQTRRLYAAHADVVEIRVYEWSMPANSQPLDRLIDATCAQQLDAVTFTSAAAVGNLLAAADELGRTDELRDAFNDSVFAMCVGPVCARSFAELGVRTMYPERARLGALVHAVTAALATKRRCLKLGGAVVAVQGCALEVDGTSSTLTDRERRVLELLIAGGGAVISKRDMRRAIWKSGTDDHTLEVVIGRLRRRMGIAGDAIVTVPRRGYRLVMER